MKSNVVDSVNRISKEYAILKPTFRYTKLDVNNRIIEVLIEIDSIVPGERSCVVVHLHESMSTELCIDLMNKEIDALIESIVSEFLDHVMRTDGDVVNAIRALLHLLS